MDLPTPSRRQFISAVGNLASASWITMNWPQIAAAAQASEHAGHNMGGADGALATVLTPAEALTVDAIANQIVPGGDSPGAREIGALPFIDNALASFFASQLPAFRDGMAEFDAGWAAFPGASGPFAAASDEQQIAYLETVDTTPFFTAVRRLTVLGLLALPKYGGNKDYKGWTLIGVEDRHVWNPPFGFYDQDYPGFEPYPGTQPYTA